MTAISNQNPIAKSQTQNPLPKSQIAQLGQFDSESLQSEMMIAMIERTGHIDSGLRMSIKRFQDQNKLLAAVREEGIE